MSIRRLLVFALIAGAPQVASAQFTTFIPPKNHVADSAKAVVVAEQKAQTDSVARAQITNMKTWVDSAAGLAPAPQTSTDSMLPATNPAVAPESTTFRNGMRAPSTASNLPLLLFAGGVLLLAGFAMLRTEPRPIRGVDRRA